MIEINTNGYVSRVFEEQDMYNYMNVNFSIFFNSYIETNFGINQDQFINIMKNIAPEEFI